MKNLLLSVILLFLFACDRAEVKLQVDKPKNFLDKAKMVELMTEMSFIEAVYQMKYVQVARYEALLTRQLDSLFQQYGLTKKDFEENINYYGNHQEEMIEIYEVVKERYTQKLKELPEIEQDTIEQKNEHIEPLKSKTKILTEEDMYVK